MSIPEPPVALDSAGGRIEVGQHSLPNPPVVLAAVPIHLAGLEALQNHPWHLMVWVVIMELVSAVSQTLLWHLLLSPSL